MQLKLKVTKQGNVQDYLNKPVLNKVNELVSINNVGNIQWNSHAIGIIIDATETDEHFELTIEIWDKFVEEVREYNNGVLDAISINFK